MATEHVIERLLRFSLIKFKDPRHLPLKTLEEAIDFAKIITEVDTTGVEPMFSPTETLHLREDVVKETSREEIQKNAVKLIEDYFVAPPGNIPLELDAKHFALKKDLKALKMKEKLKKLNDQQQVDSI